jgi:hypothetical protein
MYMQTMELTRRTSKLLNVAALCFKTVSYRPKLRSKPVFSTGFSTCADENSRSKNLRSDA